MKPKRYRYKFVHPSTTAAFNGETIRVLLQHDDLVDEDFNPEGIAEATLFPMRDAGTFYAETVIWNDAQDMYNSISVDNVEHVIALQPLIDAINPKN